LTGIVQNCRSWGQSRYLNRNRGPNSPLEFKELKSLLAELSRTRIADLLWFRAQNDDVLRKTLMVAVALRTASGNYDKAKSAISYALHFPEHVRYSEHGHGQILEEIKSNL
jgi:hypothetical protein